MRDYWLTDATSISTNPVSGSVSRKMTNPHASAVIQNSTEQSGGLFKIGPLCKCMV